MEFKQQPEQVNKVEMETDNNEAESDNDGSDNAGSDNDGSDNDGSDDDGADNAGSDNDDGSDDDGSDEDPDNIVANIMNLENTPQTAVSAEIAESTIPNNVDLEEPTYKEPILKKFNISEYEEEFTSVNRSSIFHNDIEVQKLSTVLRNSNNIVIDELHKTIPFLTRYEKARILGIRIKQLNSGDDPFIKISSKIIDTSIIANKELEEKKLPFIVRRPIPGGGFEYWKLSDLELIHF
jgi:DNA-directed RNA polymerase I, II, and III subunit RPABC2